MCICVDCRWIDRCKTYHAVERQHKVKHLTSSPDFEGENPSIHILVKDLENATSSIEWDVRACGSFVEEQGKWLQLRPGEKLPT